MARAYGTATLTLTVSEAITLNSKDEGQTHTHTIASIADIYRRTETITTSNTNLVAFGASAGLGTFDEDDVKYIRLTNLDNTNHVIFTFKNEALDEFAVKVDKGQSFVYCPDLSGGVKDTFTANQKALSFTDATCDTSSGAFTVTCDASAQIKVGQSISGTTVAADCVVATVNTPGAVTSFTGSIESTGSATNTTITFAHAGNVSDLTAIDAIADTASCDIEIYIALT
jgi:hypothetical protein|tara:strand:+ start:854 stop:1537 length:684 start_codon:yes stop_codon:yes gene_type:complete